MRRNTELIRVLLFKIEDKNDLKLRRASEMSIEGYSYEQISYHLTLLFDAGFLSGEVIRSSTSPERVIEFIPFDLTWKGHEFLAASRNQKVWKKVVGKFGDNIAGVPFSVLTALLLDEVQSRLP